MYKHLPHCSAASAVTEEHGVLSRPSVNGRVSGVSGRPGKEGTG